MTALPFLPPLHRLYARFASHLIATRQRHLVACLISQHWRTFCFIDNPRTSIVAPATAPDINIAVASVRVIPAAASASAASSTLLLSDDHQRDHFRLGHHRFRYTGIHTVFAPSTASTAPTSFIIES